MLYHEKQVAALCGVHCINTLLQGPYFTEFDLAQIGNELDQLERQMLDPETAAAAGPSSNLDESGMFSIQVLAKALQVWGLTAIPTDNQELREAPGGFDPQQEQAFICNLQEHWFTIRNMDGEWWNFNSLYPAPEQLSAFYLTAYLDSLKQQGYTIFVVRGNLPTLAADAGAEDQGGLGRWWSPEGAREAHKSAQGSRQLGRAKNAMEGAMARAAAGGGAITLRKRGAQQMNGSDEDADLAAAIAASMQDIHPPAAAAGQADSSEFNYAAAMRQGAAEGTGVSVGHELSDELFEVFDDKDPELAAALAASLAEHNGRQQHSDNHKQQANQEGQQQQAMPEVPDEPVEGADGVITVAFRLPSGARLSRRFRQTDTVAAAQAYLVQHITSKGELRQGQRVQLATLFPKKVLDEGELGLVAAGVEDRSVLSVELC